MVTKRLLLAVTLLSALLVPVSPAQDLDADGAAVEMLPTRWYQPDGLPEQLHDPIRPEAAFAAKELTSSATKAVAPLGRICIVVDSGIQADIASALTQYQADLISEGYAPFVLSVSGGSAEDLRSTLQNYHLEAESLTGAVLVGDIPYIVFELYQDWDGDGGEPREYDDFACDLFYMDLDGVWSDTASDGAVQPGNGKYDTRSGNTALEIWVSRMRTSNLTSLGSETEVLNSYFARNHARRAGESVEARSALIYDDDDWVATAADDTTAVSGVYGADNTVTLSDVETTTASDYETNQVPMGYQLMLLRSHGYPGGHGFYQNGASAFDWTFANEYPVLNPQTRFYGLYVCSGCDFTVSDNLGGMATFNPAGGGILSWGSTKTGGMWLDEYFYGKLAEQTSFGAAFVNWYNSVEGYSFAPKWWYGMVLIGDASVFVATPEPVVGPGGDSDINGDSKTNSIDIQLAITAVLGYVTGYDCDVNGDGSVNSIDIQSVISATLG